MSHVPVGSHLPRGGHAFNAIPSQSPDEDPREMIASPSSNYDESPLHGHQGYHDYGHPETQRHEGYHDHGPAKTQRYEAYHDHGPADTQRQEVYHDYGHPETQSPAQAPPQAQAHEHHEFYNRAPGAATSLSEESLKSMRGEYWDYYRQGQQQQQQQRDKPPNYKPSALKWPFLSLLLTAVLTMLALLIYAQRTLPTQRHSQPVPTTTVVAARALINTARHDWRDLGPRREPGEAQSSTSVMATSSRSSATPSMPTYSPPPTFSKPDVENPANNPFLISSSSRASSSTSLSSSGPGTTWPPTTISSLPVVSSSLFNPGPGTVTRTSTSVPTFPGTLGSSNFNAGPGTQTVVTITAVTAPAAFNPGPGTQTLRTTTAVRPPSDFNSGPGTQTQTSTSSNPGTSARAPSDHNTGPGTVTLTSTTSNPGTSARAPSDHNSGPGTVTLTSTSSNPGTSARAPTDHNPGPGTITLTSTSSNPGTSARAPTDHNSGPGTVTLTSTSSNPGTSARAPTDHNEGPGTVTLTSTSIPTFAESRPPTDFNAGPGTVTLTSTPTSSTSSIRVSARASTDHNQGPGTQTLSSSAITLVTAPSNFNAGPGTQTLQTTTPIRPPSDFNSGPGTQTQTSSGPIVTSPDFNRGPGTQTLTRPNSAATASQSRPPENVVFTDSSSAPASRLVPSTSFLTNSLGQTTGALVTSVPVVVSPSRSVSFLTNSEGRTTGSLVATQFSRSVSFLTNSLGQTTGSLVTSVPVTQFSRTVSFLTNSLGQTTGSFVTSFPVTRSGGSFSQSTTFLTNSLGSTTATRVTSFSLTAATTTTTDATTITIITSDSSSATDTASTATSSSPPQASTTPQVSITVHVLTETDYYTGLLVPLLLSILLAIPIRILNYNARLFQPWHELASAPPHGARGSLTLTAHPTGLQALGTAVRSLLGGQPLIFLTTLLALSSTILIPLSVEAVSFGYGDRCVKGSGTAAGCTLTLVTYYEPASAAAGLLAFMALLVVLTLALLLLRYRSGVMANPWSIATVATLTTNTRLRDLLAGVARREDESLQRTLERALKDRRFKLDYFPGPNAGETEYGVVLAGGAGPGQERDEFTELDPLQQQQQMGDAQQQGQYGQQRNVVVDASHGKKTVAFLMITWYARAVFLVVLAGLLALIAVYDNTGGDTGFEAFMASQGFGVRFLFTSVGVVITICMRAFFDCIAMTSPYLLMSHRARYPQHTILRSPPTNAFTGLYSSLQRRHPYFFAVSLASVLAELLPLALSQVPFNLVQTWAVGLWGRRASIALLGCLFVVVAASFAVSWPDLPVDPSTIGGKMYYLCEQSWVLKTRFLSLEEKKDRDRLIQGGGSLFAFGTYPSPAAGGAERTAVKEVGTGSGERMREEGNIGW